jgi:hypothetical protein
MDGVFTSNPLLFCEIFEGILTIIFLLLSSIEPITDQNSVRARLVEPV